MCCKKLTDFASQKKHQNQSIIMLTIVFGSFDHIFPICLLLDKYEKNAIKDNKE